MYTARARARVRVCCCCRRTWGRPSALTLCVCIYVYLRSLLMKSRLLEPRSPLKQIDHGKKEEPRPSFPLPSTSHFLHAGGQPVTHLLLHLHPSLPPSRFRPQTVCLHSPVSLLFQLRRVRISSSLLTSSSSSSSSLSPPSTRSPSRHSVRQRCDRCVMTRSVALSTC